MHKYLSEKGLIFRQVKYLQTLKSVKIAAVKIIQCALQKAEVI